MGVQTKRTRSATSPYAVTPLDLTNATASNRALSVTNPGDANASGTSFKGFSWHKSAAVATDVAVYRVDVDSLGAELLYKLESLTADASTDGQWRPDSEEVAGMDIRVPAYESSVGWRIQFSQAGAPCSCYVTADFKGV